MKIKGGRALGIQAALASAVFLGLAPVFGKQAILFGFSPLSVVALRTILATSLLLLIMVVFQRGFLFIYPAGLMGCGLAGAINGLGSILYYLSLGRLNPSVGQLLYSLYPVFLVLWLSIDNQKPGRVTLLRISLALTGVILLTALDAQRVDWIGIALMLGAAALYAMHLPINQRVLFDIPAPTVTLYTLLAMSAIVVPAFFIFDRQYPSIELPWWPLIGLTLVTFFSRLTLFLGVKHLGGMQTALLGLGELLITITISHIWLGERLLPIQWLGALFLFASLALIGADKTKFDQHGPWRFLRWLRPPGIPPNIPW
ncbi:MAG: DMT family transporter [Chloroflexota bacterium]